MGKPPILIGYLGLAWPDVNGTWDAICFEFLGTARVDENCGAVVFQNVSQTCEVGLNRVP